MDDSPLNEFLLESAAVDAAAFSNLFLEYAGDDDAFGDRLRTDKTVERLFDLCVRYLDEPQPETASRLDELRATMIQELGDRRPNDAP